MHRESALLQLSGVIEIDRHSLACNDTKTIVGELRIKPLNALDLGSFVLSESHSCTARNRVDDNRIAAGNNIHDTIALLAIWGLPGVCH